MTEEITNHISIVTTPVFWVYNNNMINSNGTFCPFSSLLSTDFTEEITNHISMTVPSVGICPLSIWTKVTFVALLLAHHSLHWLNPRLANAEPILAIINDSSSVKKRKKSKARFLTSCSAKLDFSGHSWVLTPEKERKMRTTQDFWSSQFFTSC